MQSAVISFTDTEFEAAVAYAKSRLTIVAPGLSVRTSRAIVDKWRELGPEPYRWYLMRTLRLAAWVTERLGPWNSFKRPPQNLELKYVSNKAYGLDW